jgi:regulator of nucleoside diphosphate kinase
MKKHTTVKYRVTGRTIYVAEDDRARLELLLRRTSVLEPAQAPYLSALAGELGRARVVPRSEIPPDVVTMNSVVRLRDLETEEEETYTLVYPSEADVTLNRLSVLAPVGTA